MRGTSLTNMLKRFFNSTRSSSSRHKISARPQDAPLTFLVERKAGDDYSLTVFFNGDLLRRDTISLAEGKSHKTTVNFVNLSA